MVKEPTPEELRQLELAAQQARERAKRKITEKYATAHVNEKKEVDPQEYVRRLSRVQKRNQSLISTVRQERIQASMADWQRRVGKTFANASTENPVVLERVSRIGDPYGQHKTSLVMQGPMGTGKSWLAYSYITQAIKEGKVTAGQVKMDTETGLLSKIASGGFKRVEMLEELLNPRYQIYFVDDVGQGYFSREDARTEVWYELIDHIYTHQLTLLITTNLPMSEQGLGNWVGWRGFDRLRTLVGKDGVITPGNVNRRDSVLEQNEERFRTNRGRK